MAISLLQLCTNVERKYSMKLIAGSAGLENTVRWVHMVEDSEVPDFLHGNELIFIRENPYGEGDIINPDEYYDFSGIKVTDTSITYPLEYKPPVE